MPPSNDVGAATSIATPTTIPAHSVPLTPQRAAAIAETNRQRGAVMVVDSLLVVIGSCCCVFVLTFHSSCVGSWFLGFMDLRQGYQGRSVEINSINYL